MSPRFRQEQVVTSPLERVVAFFHDVRNLKRVSPPVPRMDLMTEEFQVRPGAVFSVRLSVGPCSRTLKTVILWVNKDGAFADRLEGSPFAYWEHTHRFSPSGDGTRIVDDVDYSSPGWTAPLAALAVRIMFWFRRRAIARVLG